MRPRRSPIQETAYQRGDRVRSRHRRTYGTVVDVAELPFTRRQRSPLYLVRWDDGLVTADGTWTLKSVRG